VQTAINDTAPYSTGIPRSVLYYERDKEFQQQKRVENTQEKIQEQKQGFQVGDIVRIAEQTIDSEVRKKIKSGLSKLVIANFSKELYRVVKVIRPRRVVSKIRYKVADLKGEIIPRIFNETDLYKVDYDLLVKNTNLTSRAVKQLNAVSGENVGEIQTRSKDYKGRLRS
jgi:hypothetical protein